MQIRLSLNNAPNPPFTFNTPPIQQVHISTQVSYTGATIMGGFYAAGQGGRSGGGREHGGSQERGRQQCTPFANHQCNQTQGGGCGGKHNNGGIFIQVCTFAPSTTQN